MTAGFLFVRNGGCRLLGLGLLETETAASLFPFAALLEQVDPLETLENVPLGGNLAGAFQRCVLTHFIVLSIGAYYIISWRFFQHSSWPLPL